MGQKLVLDVSEVGQITSFKITVGKTTVILKNGMILTDRRASVMDINGVDMLADDEDEEQSPEAEESV